MSIQHHAVVDFSPWGTIDNDAFVVQPVAWSASGIINGNAIEVGIERHPDGFYHWLVSVADSRESVSAQTGLDMSLKLALNQAKWAVGRLLEVNHMVDVGD